MIDDKQWEEFCEWCKSQWSQFTPHRVSVELYLQWREERIKNLDWKWKFEEKNDKTSL